MAKKKKKKFQKKQFLSLFEKKNYQKLISKAKQFEIDGIGEDELNTILTTSYQNLAQNNFEQGDIARAVRDIDSLLQIDDDARYKLIKLKYLCYIEHFQDAIELGRELILVKNKKIQKEALFLYLMARLYSGDYELESKLLKAIPISRQRYILGFKSLLEDDKTLALDYFKKCNPRAKLEKENIKAIIGILSEEKAVSHPFMKPIYQFLLNGEANGVPNSKNFRAIKKEVKESFAKIEKNSDMKNLLALKTHIPIEAILKNAKDKEQQSRLIYNNIVLLVDKEEYNNALKLFVKYRNSLVELIESASLFIEIKNQTEDRKSNDILINFFSSYLRLHHKKIAPYQIDYILLFLIQRGDIKRCIGLAQEYNRDTFIFFIKELPLMSQFTPHYQISFNNALKKHSIFTDTLLKLTTESIESEDEQLFDFSFREKEMTLHRIYMLMVLLQNLENPHRKYKDSIFKLLQVLALIIQSFPYDKQESHYIQLSVVVNKYITYFKVDRFNLPADIKALFVSISKKKSVKKRDIYDRNVDKNSYLYLAKKFLFEEEDKDKYNFNETEYDVSIIKPQCILALERGEDDPFKILEALDGYNYYGFKIPLLLELLSKVVELKLDTNRAIQQMLVYLKLDLYNAPTRDSLSSDATQHAKNDINTAILLLKFALSHAKISDRKYAWYLKWIDGYIALVVEYKLKRDIFFWHCIDLFLETQEKKKFKSLNAKYKKIKKLKNEQGVLL